MWFGRGAVGSSRGKPAIPHRQQLPTDPVPLPYVDDYYFAIPDPQVSGDRVVWLGGDGLAYFQVVTWKVGDSSPTTLTTDAHHHSGPRVSGDRVVWVRRDGGRDGVGLFQIFAWTAGDAAPTKLASARTVDEIEVHPQVSGSRVVWHAWDGSHWQVYTRRIGVDRSPVKLTAGNHDHKYPRVSGNRVVWQAWDGSHWQIYTRRIGVDRSPVKLTSGNHDHVYPRVSGDRVVWSGRYGGSWQIYRAKRITRPSITRSPSPSTLTVYRHDGVARYTLAATLRDRDGTLVAGKRVYLQTSSDGRTWRNTYRTLRTNRLGQVSKSFTKLRRMTLYYRWYAPSSPGYRRAYTAGQRVRVR